MGTAVLLPQDCLPTSKGRHKPNFTDAVYGSNSSSRAREGTFQALDLPSFCVDQSRQKFNLSRRAGWRASRGHMLHLEYGQALAINSSVQRELEGKPMARRLVEARDAKLASKPGPDVPVFTILQRPKDKELANELIVKFLVKVDESKQAVGSSDTKFDVKVKEGKLGNSTQNPHLKRRMSTPATGRSKCQSPKLDVSKFQALIPCRKVDSPTAKDLEEDGSKVHRAALVSSMSVAKRNDHRKFDELLPAKGLKQMLCPKVPTEHKSPQTSGAAVKFSCMLAHENRNAKGKNAFEVDVAQLRRALSDPKVGKHTVGQCRSAVMEIPRTDARSLHGISRSNSMSCPERWAGPAYCSSPAPSSLPLPKFSQANQRLSSSELSSLPGKGCNSKGTQIPESGVGCAAPGVLQGGELDMASATRILRRMLKLDPF